jgi:hypothetical protein
LEVTPGSVAAPGESVMRQPVEGWAPQAQMMARGWIGRVRGSLHRTVLRRDPPGLRPLVARVEGHPGLAR